MASLTSYRIEMLSNALIVMYQFWCMTICTGNLIRRIDTNRNRTSADLMIFRLVTIHTQKIIASHMHINILCRVV